MKGTRPEWTIVLSRVVEKTAKFNCLQKEWLLQHLKDRGFVKAWVQITWLSDCGPNLRCNRTLAHSCIRFVELHQVHSQHIFALECHGKGELDGKMGDLSRRKHEAATLKMIIDIGGLKKVFETTHNERKALAPVEDEVFFDWLPMVSKAAFKSYLLTAKSFKVPIKDCYSWRFRCEDQRKVRIINKQNKVTGTMCYAQLLPKALCTAERSLVF